MTLELAECTVPAKGTKLIKRAVFSLMKYPEKLWKCHAGGKLCAEVMIFLYTQLRWQVKFRWVVILVLFTFFFILPASHFVIQCLMAVLCSHGLKTYTSNEKFNLLSFEPLKTNPFCLSCQSMAPLNYLRRSIFNDRVLLPWNLSSRFLWEFLQEYYSYVLSQAPVDPDHEGHSPGHRGQTLLGMSSEWQAQTLLHLAEERPAAPPRGKILPPTSVSFRRPRLRRNVAF